MVTVGAVLPTVTGTFAVALRPSESVTVSWAVKLPLPVYVCVGLGSVDVPPSPNDQANVMACPSGSREPALENCTARGAGPLVGFAAACAIGARSPAM